MSKAKTKKKKIIIYVVVAIIFLYVLIKGGLLFYYGSFYQSSLDLSNVKFSEKTIKTDKSLANQKFKNINFYLPDGMAYKDYEQNDGYMAGYVNIEDIDNNSSTKNIIIFNSMGCDDFSFDKEIRNINPKKIMNKNNFKNKFDVLKYEEQNKDKKVNLFSSYNNIKLNYYLKVCNMYMTIKNRYDYYYLNGDITGLFGEGSLNNDTLISKKEYSIEVYNEKENKYYYVSIYEYRDSYNEYEGDTRYNEIFNDELIEKILSSIYFD